MLISVSRLLESLFGVLESTYNKHCFPIFDLQKDNLSFWLEEREANPSSSTVQKTSLR